MDVSLILSTASAAAVPIIMGFVAYGKLSQKSISIDETIRTNSENINEKLKSSISSMEEKIKSNKEAIDEKMDSTKAAQDERDRRQDARTAATELKLETHSSDLSDMKVVLARVDTNLSHLVDSLKNIEK